MADQGTTRAEITISEKLKTFLKDFPELRVDRKKGKVCCCLTGHEMPPREEVVRSYVEGKKFLKAQQQREYNFDQHKPHLVPNTKRGFEQRLFCTLTLRHVARRPADVERHVRGKRYQRALKRWERCQETGEKFKARGGKKRYADSELVRGKPSRAKNAASDPEEPGKFWNSDSEVEGEEDDMSDLYPSEDFTSDEEEEGEGGMEGRAPPSGGGAGDEGDFEEVESEAEDEVSGQPPRPAVKRRKTQVAIEKKRKRSR